MFNIILIALLSNATVGIACLLAGYWIGRYESRADTWDKTHAEVAKARYRLLTGRAL